MLSEQQRQQFRTEGYLLVPDALADIGPQRVRDAYEQVRAQTGAQWRETVAADTGKGSTGRVPPPTSCPTFTNTTRSFSICPTTRP